MEGAFHGAAVITLDAKGRVAIPTRQRSALLQAGKSLVLTAHPDGCVLIYPVAEWEPVADELERKIVWWESVLYFTVWAPLQEIRKRLGLVDLRKRWFGGRFARV